MRKNTTFRITIILLILTVPIGQVWLEFTHFCKSKSCASSFIMGIPHQAESCCKHHGCDTKTSWFNDDPVDEEEASPEEGKCCTSYSCQILNLNICLTSNDQFTAVSNDGILKSHPEWNSEPTGFMPSLYRPPRAHS